MPRLPDASEFTKFKRLSSTQRSRGEDYSEKFSNPRNFVPSVTTTFSLPEFLTSVGKVQQPPLNVLIANLNSIDFSIKGARTVSFTTYQSDLSIIILKFNGTPSNNIGRVTSIELVLNTAEASRFTTITDISVNTSTTITGSIVNSTTLSIKIDVPKVGVGLYLTSEITITLPNSVRVSHIRGLTMES